MTVSSYALPEYEDELEGEYEGEDFDLGGIVQGLLGESEYEGEYELEAEDELEGEWEDEYELEGEWEDEYEDESERMANPLRRVYPDAMMEHLGAAAAEAETEAEAEAFIGALVPLAASLARSAAPAVARATPHLVRGLSRVTRTLRRNPSTRPLVRTLPLITARTTHSLARGAAHGRPITPRRALRTLAGHTNAVLSRPHTRNHAIRRSRALDHRYHRAVRNGQWWTGTVPSRSATTVRALAHRPMAPRGATPVHHGAPGVRYRTHAVGAGIPVRRIPARQLPGRGHPRRRRHPFGLTTAWIPVQAWCDSAPPHRAYRH
jgi:hypothetical protein